MATEISVPVIDRVIELQPARTFDVDGYTYIDKDKSVTLFKPPVADALPLHTLSGFAALIDQQFEGFDPAKAVVHVEAYDEVQLIPSASDKFGRRTAVITAKALQPERRFTFNQYIPQEDFNIALRSMFVQDDELESLSQLAGNIAKDTTVRQEDDGFAQSVTVKGGVVLVREKTLKPRVTLRPFRTFLEVDQPAGDFIFRVKHDEMKGNLCALFEADAGAWKLTAMDLIAAWLRQRITTSETVEVRNIPVIA